MGEVLDDGDGEVHFAGVGLGRGGDGVEPRGDLVGEREEFRDGEVDGVLGDDVGVVAGEDVVVEGLVVADDFGERGFLFALGQALEHGLDEFLADAVEDVAADEDVARGDGAGGLLDGGLRVDAEVGQEVVGPSWGNCAGRRRGNRRGRS